MTNRHYRNQKRIRGWKRVLLIIGIILLALILITLSVFGVLWTQGRHTLLASDTASMTTPSGYDITVEDGQTVIYNGESYIYNDNMTAILCMGIDQTEKESQNQRSNGQADTLLLIAVDTETGKTTVLNISRDTMAEVGTYTQDGIYIGIETQQICLAYAYGDGAHTSCENTVLAVSRLLYGIPINTYFSIDWSSVALLTDTIGGVTVPAYDSDWNPTGGTTYLTGDNALNYLRGRRKDVVDANNNRMNRQIAYLKAYAAKVVEQSRANPSFPLRLFNTLNSDSVNNIDTSKITYLSTVFLNNGAQLDFQSIAGEIVMGEKYAEMHVDQQALFEQVLDIFYQKQ